MRKFLLASVATLGTGGLMGAAFAQAPAGPVGGPTQGQVAWPLANPLASANTNNNYQAPALPGPLANPTPGTIVIHVAGKVQTTFQSSWSSLDQRTFVAPAGAAGGPPITVTAAGPGGGIVGATVTPTSLAFVQGVNGTGTAKVAPTMLNSFMRLYFGADAMATNGLRYGAGIELRENFPGYVGSNSATSSSGYSSSSTVFVRRAFTYAAGENWGLFRLGMADGVIGIFDNGVTSGQFLINGFGGGDLNSYLVPVPFFFLSTQGAEYDNTKAVYLSPQIAGFDFGIQWAPNASNGIAAQGGTGGGYGTGINGSGIGTGLTCTTATSGCPNLSSGPGILDGSKVTNQTVLGLRYQGILGGVGILGYAAWEHSGTVNYTGLRTAAVLGTGIAVPAGVTGGSTFTGSYDGLNFGSGGLALTYAGFTLAGNIIGGALNNQGAPRPTGGASEIAYILSLKYVTGPLTVGIQAEEAWYQGDVVLTGLSQRRARGVTFGGTYTVAPGFIAFAEYLFQDAQQAGFNFVSGGRGFTAASGGLLNNNAKTQGFLIGNVINF
jgi:hypothetical protein